MVSDLFWKPFDSRFFALLERMRFHQDVFKNEMQLEESKYRELQGGQQAYKLRLAGEALRQIQEQIAGLRQSNEDLELKISTQFNNLESKMQWDDSTLRNVETIQRQDAEVLSKRAQFDALIISN